MTFDAFISYSSKDRLPVEICNRLESHGVKCWIAPRNIEPGTSYVKGIMNGLENSSIVLVFISSNSLTSEDVLNEVENAHRHKRTIIPVFIENVELNQEFSYYLNRKQWTDLYSDIDKGFTRLLSLFNTSEKPIAPPPPIVENHKIFPDLPLTDMVRVEGGMFMMGATPEQFSAALDSEKPMHSVRVSDFFICKYAVTQQLWEYVMNYNGACADGSTINSNPIVWPGGKPAKGVGDAYPAYGISYEDIVGVFLPRLNQITGKEYRLPTEAEWEYAARGGRSSMKCKYAGSDNADDVAWCWDNAEEQAHPVGEKQPNELGLYDMTGNVWEWCSDWLGDYRISTPPNPTGPLSGSARVYRGGGWYSRAASCRISYRNSGEPTLRNDRLGFRLVCQ